MNIHFNDQVLLNKLKNASLLNLKVGSHLFGLDNENSDEDIFHVHAKAKNQNESFLVETSLLQFKEKNRDLIFSSLHLFIRTLVNGGNTINFEVLHSQELKNSSLSFLYDHKQEFYNYKNIRAYLGLAKRDLSSLSKDFIDTKRLSHGYRSILSAEAIVQGNYDNNFSNYDKEFQIIKELKNGNFDGDKKALVLSLEKRTATLREELNNMLNQKKVIHSLNTNFMKELDSWLRSYTQTSEYLEKSNFETSMDLYYKALEEGVKY